MRVLLYCLLVVSPGFCQPRAVEVFGQVGRSRFGGGEGSPGSATAFGAGAVLPITGKWAVDVDVQSGRSSKDNPPDRFSIRRTLLSPAVVRRWGTARLYGFAGAGVGLQVDQTESVWRTYSGSPPVMTGLGHGRYTESGATLIGKLGMVAAPVGPLLIRGDLLLAWRYVMPTAGVRIGVGYRF